jgi:selenocysteine lyase/cysteine desulfurase
MLNIDQLRQDTPGTEHAIHFNNAGAALPPRPVMDTLLEFLQTEAATGGYEIMTDRWSEFKRFREVAARLIHAEAAEMAFCVSATDAYNKALTAIPWQAGDLVLTTDYDYVSNQIAFLQLAKRHGIRIERAASLPDGRVDPEDLIRRLRAERPKLVAVTHVPTDNGLAQDIHSVGRACRDEGILYLVDACQSVGQLVVDVREIHCDFLAATARKWLRGPRGAGFLFAAQRTFDLGLEPFGVDGWGGRWSAPDQYEPAPDAKRYENFERNMAIQVAFTAALEYALELGMEAIQERVLALNRYLQEQVQAVPGVALRDPSPAESGITTLRIDYPDGGPALNKRLRAAGVNGSTVLRLRDPINFPAGEPDWGLRWSPHYYNTEAEVDRAVGILREVLSE